MKPDISDLRPEDRRFAEHLIRLSLKRSWQLRPLIASYLTKPPETLPHHVYLLLLIAAAQCLYMEVPAYAAVNTGVELSRHLKRERFSGMINAILNNISRQQQSGTLPTLPPALAQTPDWFQHRLRHDYGQEEAEAIADASLSDLSVIDITLRDPQTRDHYAQALDATPVSAASLRLSSPGTLTELPGFAEGAWWVQDAASAGPLQALRPLLKGKRVLDACAAPGGKTLQLCAGGADVTALDRSAKRLERLRDNLTRTGFAAEIICADLADYEPDAAFDLIVLDAPCSATGTLRRNPDILYQRSEANIAAVIDIQRRMLARVTDWLAPGGILLYATCSLFHDEGEAQIARFIQEAPQDWQMLSSDWQTGGLPLHHPASGMYRTHPALLTGEGGMDGFFAAAVQRRIN